MCIRDSPDPMPAHLLRSFPDRARIHAESEGRGERGCCLEKREDPQGLVKALVAFSFSPHTKAEKDNASLAVQSSDRKKPSGRQGWTKRPARSTLWGGKATVANPPPARNADGTSRLALLRALSFRWVGVDGARGGPWGRLNRAIMQRI